VVALVILVAVLLMIPLAIWSTRVRARRIAWGGIDWSRGLAPGAQHVADGTRLHREARYVEALAAFDRAVALDPDDADALLARGVTRQRLGRLDDALADYDRAIAVRGPTSEALNNRGCLQRDRGELDRALADVEEAVRLAPTDAVAQVSLAEVRAARGEWDAALDALAKGIAIDPAWKTHARTSDALAKLRAARPDAAPFVD
jgi:tetratricopeptide (TPR) repeat protein